MHRQADPMSKRELEALYVKVSDIYDERKRLGDFDANSLCLKQILDVLLDIIAHQWAAIPDPKKRTAKKKTKKRRA